jgi:hypothetical protein
MSKPVYALDLFSISNREEYLAYSKSSAKEAQAHGGRRRRDQELSMTGLFVSGPKCPHAQAASNDRCDPGGPHRHVETCDMHRPLIQSPHRLKRRYDAEDSA